MCFAGESFRSVSDRAATTLRCHVLLGGVVLRSHGLPAGCGCSWAPGCVEFVGRQRSSGVWAAAVVLGSRSFRRVRWLSKVCFATSLRSRSRQLREVTCDDDDMVMGGPICWVSIRRKPRILSIRSSTSESAPLSRWHEWPIVWHGPTRACVPAEAVSPFLGVGGGSRSRQLRRSACVMTTTSASNLDGYLLGCVR